MKNIINYIRRKLGLHVTSKSKVDGFESVWVNEYVNELYDATDFLSDEEYIDYHIWEEQNIHLMFKKYFPR